MTAASARPRHANPVCPDYFADPFVWQHDGVYYAVGTGELEATGHPGEKVFPLLESEDFFHWRPAGRALIRPDPSLGANFWAPAVAFDKGIFYLYYSVGHGDKLHQLRVAVSEQPLGPYRDLDRPLLAPQSHPFAIDPHPFQDRDGQWYLFYARDFLDTTGGARAGTALAAAQMASMTELANPGEPILRAHADWQRFEMNRQMYGGVWDWHTLEGPCPWRHGDHYYCFYSGGRWENETYGVDYATAANVLGPYSTAGSDGGPRVLRTIPGRLVGPGHNSLVVGPDGRTEYLVYHAWDAAMKARQMHVEAIEWTHAGPRPLR